MTSLDDYSSFFTSFSLIRSQKGRPCEVSFEQQAEVFFRNFNEAFIQVEASEPCFESAPLNYDECQSFFSNFSNTYKEHLQQGRAVNILNVVRIGSDEQRNCNLLAWLLDAHGNHGQGSAFLQSLLNLVQHGKCHPLHFPTSVNSDTPYNTYLESSYDEENDLRSRVDIEIASRYFHLFIEAKVNSSESEGQLNRYLNIIKNKAGNLPYGLIFLTRKRQTPRDKDICHKVACLSWSDIGISFLKQLESMPDSHGRTFIRQVCNHFNSL